MTRATQSAKQLLGVKRYASILAVVWTLCVAPVFAGEAVPSSGSAIRSGCEYDYPPFCIVEESGHANGFSVELLRAALQAMNRDVTFRNGPWAEVKGLLERSEIDVLPLVGRTAAREATFDFTFPYMSLHAVIVVQEGTTDIHDLSDLRGRRVAVMKGDTAEEFLRRADRGFEIHTTPTFEDALRELSDGLHDAVVIQRLVALRLFQKAGITDLRIVGKPPEGFRQDACFAVTEGDREMLSLLNEGLALVIADGTFSRLQREWFTPPELPSDRRIVIGVALSLPPYSFLDENGQETGYSVDLTRAIARVMQMDVEVRIGPWEEIRQALETGDIDAAPMYYSVERDKLVDFSSPFSIVHNAIFMRRDTPAIETEDGLRGKDIIVIRGDIMHDYVLQNGLSDNPVLAPTESDALRLLASGEHDCALMARIPGLYWAKELKLSNIVTVGPLLYPSEICYAVKEGNTALQHLLSEGLVSLEETGEHKRIHDKWLGVLVPRGVSLSTVLKYIAFAVVPLLLLLALFIIWSRALKRQVTLRTLELSESEERYRAVAEDTPVLICRFLPGGEITYANEAYCTYFGKTSEELIGSSFISLIPESERKIVMANISAITVNSPNQSHEHQVIGAEGEIRWTSWTNRALFDAQGEAVTYQSIGEDISERKQAEKTLQRSEALLNATQQLIKVGGWEWDVEKQTMFWTDEVYRIHDFQPNEFVTGSTKHIEQGIECYDPEDRPVIMAAFRRCAEKGQSYDLEFPFTTTKGRRIWIRTVAEPVMKGDRVVKVVGNIMDITESKQAAEELEKHREHLEELVKERTAELEEKNAELERMNEVFTGREFRIKELRDRVRELELKIDD